MSPARREAARGRAAAPFGPELALFWVSALALFLELLLIRWVSTEIRIFAYLQNTVLVVCFLGLGAGLFSARRPVWIGRAMWSLVVLMALLAIPFSRRLVHRTSELLSVLGGLSIWNEGFGSDPLDTALRVLLGLTLTFAVMALILPPFLPIGRLLGRLLDAHPRPILAYSLNLLGSLTGVWLFVLLSWLQLSPVWWFAVFGLISLPLAAARGPRGWIPALPLLLVVILSRFTTEAPHARETVWSPYQKLALYGPDSGGVGPLGYTIEVNNVGYQAILDLRPETVATTPDIHPAEQAGYSQYDIPLRTHPAPSRVLIVGAGAGNDAAGALRQGAERVTAVEIDPAILDFGRRYHPERPYESERVRVVTDDARSFFAREDEAYDLIIFGLLDSHTTTAMTNARLDHYVYTRESIERARDLLAEGGVLALGFEAAKPFIADRMAGVLREAFGEEPIVFRVPRNGYGWGGVLFLAGDLDGVRTQIAGDPRLASLIATWKRQHPVELSYSTAPTTDDWPYVYLERRRVPALYFLLGGLMVLLFLYV
ncbi:MAG: methyltransferase domain-containing protein, partial [Gemmatimonadota bacterium]